MNKYQNSPVKQVQIIFIEVLDVKQTEPATQETIIVQQRYLLPKFEKTKKWHSTMATKVNVLFADNFTFK